jgi:hypothetical protein
MQTAIAIVAAAEGIGGEVPNHCESSDQHIRRHAITRISGNFFASDIMKQR